MSERIPAVDKTYLLEESKTFCMFPWLHLNVTPKGDIYPCCSNDYTDPFGNTKETSLKEAFNSDKMKQLRLDMLNEKKNSVCDFCYKHEEAGPHSFRNYSKEHFGQHFDKLVPNTGADGHVHDFNMHYFDIRFSNICNFKCRTCGSEFSSQWGAEMRENHDPKHPILIHADDQTGTVLEEVIEHIDEIELCYFAGGEPMLTEEHFLMLEEFIRRGKRPVLRYNTNASQLKYKKYDILELWKHFDKVEVSCSVDHFGERAEWLRKGTNWGTVENNLLMFRDLEQVEFSMNTVFSMFNYPMIGEFYQYLKDKGVVRAEDWYNSLYLAVHPSYYSAKSLPKELKIQAAENALKFADKFEGDKTSLSRLIRDAVNFANEDHTWADNKSIMLQHTASIDNIRDEDFWSVFPELNRIRDLHE